MAHCEQNCVVYAQQKDRCVMYKFHHFDKVSSNMLVGYSKKTSVGWRANLGLAVCVSLLAMWVF